MHIKLFVLALALASLLSCKTTQLIHPSTPGNELFKVAFLYPNGEGNTFDLDYYESSHMPMVAGFVGDNLKFYEIDKGISGRTPDDEAPFLAVGYLYVKNVAAYSASIGQNIDAILADIPNYTNVRPTIQISEVTKVGYNGQK